MYPKLEVGINKDLDKMMCLEFFKVKKSGIDFGKGIARLHPELEKMNGVDSDKQKTLVNTYFDSFYRDHSKEIEYKRDQFAKDWVKIKSKFSKTCDKYFDNIPWPQGIYTGFLSIINCNPRFIENKTFQVYWKHNNGFVPVAAHEMLHFLFYHLISTCFPTVDINSNKVWELSEVFNIFLLREPDFVEITKDPNPDSYPELINLQEDLYPIWKETKNAQIFLEKVFR